MNAFLESVASVLEVPSVGLDDRFRESPGWCSLHGFGLLVLMENDWRAPVKINRFLELETVRDLYREVFLAFASRLLGVPRESLTGATAYGSIPQWDSVNHLKLAMEAEKFFSVSYALEKIPFLKTLDDFLIS